MVSMMYSSIKPIGTLFGAIFIALQILISLQHVSSLQPNKLGRFRAFRPRKIISRRKYRNYDDDIDGTSPSNKERQQSQSQSNVGRSRKVLPNLRLSQVVRRIHAKADSKLLTDLHLAYGSAIDDGGGPGEGSIMPEYAAFVKKRQALAGNSRAAAELMPNIAAKKTKIKVGTAEELRAAVLDNGNELKDIELVASNNITDQVVCEALNHDVLDLIVQRFESGSKPSARQANDTARLALAIEGGGMRGAVSAGMAAAVACLGLCDTFDAIYGSSAGSVVGAYMVSRQMCIDVYTDLLTAAKKAFVSKGRIFAHLAKNLARVVLTNKTSTLATLPLEGLTPGMNISFVLEGIMCPHNGLRPLDLEAFRANDALQPLRVVASSLRNGKMEAICFGSKEKDFFDEVTDEGMVDSYATTSADGRRHGLFSCLEASMSVPGAAGPPINLIRSKDAKKGTITAAFDAFCYEPLPYRSAVEEGATHVLVLRSRPEGFPIKTKPGIYERGVASIYFRAHGQNEVASYFERGGQQYIYAEDILTLDEAKESSATVPVPPAKILYGSTDAQSGEAHHLSDNRHEWKKAALFPIAVSRDTKELKSLEQGEEEVLQAVRGGFAAAYDVLAPAVGLEIDGLTGQRVAELVFPKFFSHNFTKAPLQSRNVRGEIISRHDDETKAAKKHERRRKRFKKFLNQREECAIPEDDENYKLLDDTTGFKERIKLTSLEGTTEPCPKRDARTLLAFLPGLQSGRLAPLAEGLMHHKHSNTAE